MTPVGEKQKEAPFIMNRTYFDGTFFVLNKNGNVMVTSDIGLLNVKYSFSNNTSKCAYKNDHGLI